MTPFVLIWQDRRNAVGAGDGVDSRLDRLFSSLDSSFSAAIERSEDEAADDLALSLKQDQPLARYLSGIPVSVRGEVAGDDVVEVGRDFVRTAANRLYPLAGPILERRPEGSAPELTDRYLVEVLRAAVRSGSSAEIEGEFGRAAGALLRCGPDHISINERGSEVLIPLGPIRVLRLSRAD